MICLYTFMYIYMQLLQVSHVQMSCLVRFTCDLRVISIFWWGSAVLPLGLCPLCIVLRERSEHCRGALLDRLGYI